MKSEGELWKSIESVEIYARRKEMDREIKGVCVPTILREFTATVK